MARVYSEDAYCLGLLYVYIYSNTMQQMVLIDDLKKIHNCIEENLEAMNSTMNNIYATIWNDNEESIYFTSNNKNGETYYILKPRFDLKRAKSLYIGCLPLDILVASQMDNALNCLGLQIIDDKIKVKDINTKRFIDRFMERLNKGELKKDICPQMDDEFILTDENIKKELILYRELLNSDIMKNILEKEETPVLKKIKD